MNGVLSELYDTILGRMERPEEGSYTAYLFHSGLDKILKKIAEECGETIIAAKNGDKEQMVSELSDLFYHLLVLMAAEGVTLQQVTEELSARQKKTGNLKPVKTVDKNS